MNEVVNGDESENGAGSTTSTSRLLQSQQNATQIRDFFSPRLCWLPIWMGIFLGLSMIVPYCIAVSLGHVKPIFPYVSDDGTYPPESCIFAQLLNLAAFFAFATVGVRYKQINEYYRDVTWKVLKWNKAAVVLGALAALGLSLAANFQKTNIKSVHLIGGALCFGVGSVYGFIQSWISYKLMPRYSSLLTCRLRLSSSIFATIFLLTTLLFDELSKLTDLLPKDVCFAFHIVSTTSEWANTIAFMIFFLTFIREFQKIETEVKQWQRLLVLNIPYGPME